MKIHSIRARLPISYALIALLTALVLGGLLLLTLQNFYRTQEYEYLSTNASLMAPGLTKVIEDGQDNSALDIYTQNLSYLIQARIRLFDMDNNLLVDTGSTKTRKYVYTNLTPDGMSAEILPEGRTDRYLFYASINVLTQPLDDLHLDGNPAFLAPMPSHPALFGVIPGTQGSQEVRPSDQIVTILLFGPSGEEIGVLEVSEGVAFGGTIIENVARAWLAAGAAAVIIAAVSGWFVGRRFTAPLTELTLVTEKMAGGDLSARSGVRSRDEFFSLGQSFNLMAAKVENIVETLRRFIADSAHELLTPVAALRLNLELAEEDPNYHNFLNEAQAQAERLQTLVDNLLDLSKIESAGTQFEPVSLTKMVKKLEEIFLPLTIQRNISFEVQLPPEDILIFGDEEQLSTALENLIDNAIKFSEDGGSVVVGLAVSDQSVAVCVEDDGIGIPEDERNRAFQRFFRGRNTSALPGSGLGLAIVKAIADRHAAEINLESTQEGTRVTLTFQK